MFKFLWLGNNKKIKYDLASWRAIARTNILGGYVVSKKYPSLVKKFQQKIFGGLYLT